MGRLWIVGLLAAAICARAAETDANTVTVTDLYSGDSSPNRVLLYVTLTAPVELGLDDVLAQIKSSGITASDLSNVYPQNGNLGDTGYTQWTFSPVIAIDNMKSVLTALSQLEAVIGEAGGSPALRFEVNGLTTTDRFRAMQVCPWSTMIFEARRQADVMAAAAGMRTGAIVSVSDGSSVDEVAAVGGLAQFVFGAAQSSQSNDWFILNNGLLTNNRLIQQPCSVTVQFRLLP